jgi:DNA-binding NarL/FixJ family response regulator
MTAISTPTPPTNVTTRPKLAALTLAIVDDDPDSRYALWARLRWESGVRVATASGAEATKVVMRERPAVCLVSATLGIGCVYDLTQLPCRPRVLMYSDRRGGTLDGPALIAGADALFWRYGDIEELTEAIRRVAEGRRELPDLPREEIRRLIDRVEDRDRSIAAMLLLHVPPDEIARTAGISGRALEARRSELVRRLA